MIDRALNWIEVHPELVAWMTGASLAMLVATAVLAIWTLLWLDEDYLTSEKPGPRFGWAPGPLRIGLLVAKNVLAWLLVVAGIAMLALPGQGLLTIAVGLVLADGPGKRRIERAVLGRPGVLRRVNALRRRAGRRPLRAARCGEGTELRRET
ncbi:MAG: PGPGW domain-containing protein [Phycisphaerales bacterium JB039]